MYKLVLFNPYMHFYFIADSSSLVIYWLARQFLLEWWQGVQQFLWSGGSEYDSTRVQKHEIGSMRVRQHGTFFKQCQLLCHTAYIFVYHSIIIMHIIYM